MQKLFRILFVFTLIFLSACGTKTWVLEKNRLSETGEVKSYVEQLQTAHSDVRGYKVFTIAEGKKMVVVSSGTSDHSFIFKGADVTSDRTTITVEEKIEETNETNSYILIGIDKIKGELTVTNTDGDEFQPI
ncbi:hypothetical protein ACLIA0_06020 [Bacillaceae bacterium W0354]